MDVRKLNKLGWKFKTGLEEGVGKIYDDFLTNRDLRKQCITAQIPVYDI